MSPSPEGPSHLEHLTLSNDRSEGMPTISVKESAVLRVILISVAAGSKHGLQKSTCGAGVVRAAAYFNLSPFHVWLFPFYSRRSNLLRRNFGRDSLTMSTAAPRAAIGDSDAATLQSHGRACSLLGMAADNGIIWSDLCVNTNNCQHSRRSCC